MKSHTKPLVFIEDKYDQIYKIAWLSLFEISFDLQTFESVFERECPFSIFRAEGASSLSGFLRTPNIDFWSDRKVVGIFDFDVTGVAQFKCIKNKSYWKDPSLGVKTSGIFKKRLDHLHFYALLLPIPDELNAFADLDFPSVVEIENLLPKSFIDKYTFANEITLAGGVTFPQIKEAKKPVIWKDLFELKKEDFKNFRPLFQKIYELLEIP